MRVPVKSALALTGLVLFLTTASVPAGAVGAAAGAGQSARHAAATLLHKAGGLPRYEYKERRSGWRHRRHSNGWPVQYGYRFQPFSGWQYGARYYPWYRPERRW